MEDYIIKVFGLWMVTDYGLEYADGDYDIDKEQIYEDYWIEHIKGKAYVSSYGFKEALDFARRYHMEDENTVYAVNPERLKERLIQINKVKGGENNEIKS